MANLDSGSAMTPHPLLGDVLSGTQQMPGSCLRPSCRPDRPSVVLKRGSGGLDGPELTGLHSLSENLG